MNQDEQDATIGRVLREAKEANTNLGNVLSKMDRIAGRFVELSSKMREQATRARDEKAEAAPLNLAPYLDILSPDALVEVQQELEAARTRYFATLKERRRFARLIDMKA